MVLLDALYFCPHHPRGNVDKYRERFDQSKLRDPESVASNIRHVLEGPVETAVPEIMVIPLQETSWP